MEKIYSWKSRHIVPLSVSVLLSVSTCMFVTPEGQTVIHRQTDRQTDRLTEGYICNQNCKHTRNTLLRIKILKGELFCVIWMYLLQYKQHIVKNLSRSEKYKICKTFLIKYFPAYQRCRWHRRCTLSYEYLSEFRILGLSGAWGKLKTVSL
jgi:hypothetical protein